MLKWLFSLVLLVVVFGLVTPWLKRRGHLHLPGDVRIKARGREFYFPFASVIVLSLVFSVVFHWIG